MEIITDQYIIGQRVKMDGKHFQDCVLLECTLEYAGGEMILERTQITRCNHLFRGSARLTLSFLELMGMMKEDSVQGTGLPELVH